MVTQKGETSFAFAISETCLFTECSYIW